MSFTKGVSFHHETNASSQATSNPTITNNISIHATNELSESTQYKVLEPGEVRYDKQSQPVQTESHDQASIINENEFLKKVLAIYMNQKIYWQNKSIVLKPDELLDLIDTLLPDKQITITINDLDEVNCCGFIKDIPIKKVDTIWVSTNDVQENFKYCYSNLVSLLDQYKISIKFVRAQ